MRIASRLQHPNDDNARLICGAFVHDRKLPSGMVTGLTKLGPPSSLIVGCTRLGELFCRVRRFGAMPSKRMRGKNLFITPIIFP